MTIEALPSRRGERVGAAHARLAGALDRPELVVVEHEGELLVPELFVDETGEPKAEFGPATVTLVGAGEDGWGLWVWLVHPSAFLDGAVPAEELTRRP